MLRGFFFRAGIVALGTVMTLVAPTVVSAHWSYLPHNHDVLQVYGSYHEPDRPVTIREYCNGSETQTASFSHTDTFEATNGWGIGIGFSKSAVSSALRFDVDRTYSARGYYEQTIRPMSCIRLSRISMYEMTSFLGVTRWLWGNEYALGYAGRFLYPIYSTHERSL